MFCFFFIRLSILHGFKNYVRRNNNFSNILIIIYIYIYILNTIKKTSTKLYLYIYKHNIIFILHKKVTTLKHDIINNITQTLNDFPKTVTLFLSFKKVFIF